MAKYNKLYLLHKKLLNKINLYMYGERESER